MTDADVVRRIKQVTLENFRGFKVFDPGQKARDIDTDADLVLLSGPNGCGKSSFLEALLLLLTGWYDADDEPDTFPERALISRRAGKGGTDGGPAPQCSLHAVVQSREANATRDIGLTWSSSHNGILPIPTGLPSSQLRSQASENPTLDKRELDARLCGFFQDRVPMLFDQAARGLTVRDVFEPLPAIVDYVAKQLEKLPADIQRQRLLYKDDREEQSKETLDSALATAWLLLAPLLRRAADLGAFPLNVPDAISDDKDLDSFARALVAVVSSRESQDRFENLRRQFERRIGDALKKAIEKEASKARDASEKTREIEAQLLQVRGELNEIAQRFPRLDAELALFPPEDSAFPDALAIFRSLTQNAERWGRKLAGDDADLRTIQEQFANVSITEAAKCAGLLTGFLGQRRAAARRRDELRSTDASLEDDLQRSRSSERLTALRQLERYIREPLRAVMNAWDERHKLTQHEEAAAGRKAARERLDGATEALRWCGDKVAAMTAPDKTIMEYVRGRAHEVMQRFSVVKGVLPLRLTEGGERLGEGLVHRTYHVVTEDGRRLEHLSTGQRAQAAVAFLIAQNQAASHLLNHRIILLDDVTTAYDLSNLAREATLWRQLAYGETGKKEDETGRKEDDERMLRQVFISSHHEDMTNHLLDLLAPPPGRSMRLIRFLDWSPETGPKIEQCEVESSSAVSDAALKDALEDGDRDMDTVRRFG